MNEYMILNLWIISLLENKETIVHIKREARIVNNLKVKLLVRTDIFESEKIDLLFNSDKMIINSCKALIILISTSSKAA